MDRQTSSRREEEKKKNKLWIILILLLLLLTLIALGLCVWVLFFRSAELTPDYAPKQEAQNAVAIENDDQVKLEKPEGGTAVGITYVPEVTIDLSDEEATIMFQNPGRSNNDIVLQIVIQDEIIAQSDRLVPGKQLNSLELLRGAADKLSPGGYEGKFVILFYDPVSSERSVLKSEGAITIEVVQ